MHANRPRILSNACANGNGEIVRFLAKDPSLDLQEGLLLAIQHSQPEIVQLLLATGRIRSLQDAFRCALTGQWSPQNKDILRILHKHAT